ncbi:MAG: DUF6263 family protein [Gemmataceae bacterium]
MLRLRFICGLVLAGSLFAVAMAQEKQKFEIKFEKDKAFFQELTTDVQQTIKVQGGADLTQKHKQTFFFKITPTVQAGDKWTARQTIEGAKMAIDIAGNAIEYDSTNPTGGPGNNLADFFSKLVGTEFVITFGKGMIVEKVDGKDDFLKKLGTVNQQMEAILKKILTDDALKQMSDPSFGLTPPGEQAPNGTWEKKSTLSLGPIGSYDVTYKYTYKGKDAIKKELDRVELVTTLVYKAPAENADGLLFKIKSGELKSEEPKADAKPNFMLFNSKTGRVEESEVSVKLKGTINVTIGGTDTVVEIYQEQTTRTRSGEKSYLPTNEKK